MVRDKDFWGRAYDDMGNYFDAHPYIHVICLLKDKVLSASRML